MQKVLCEQLQSKYLLLSANVFRFTYGVLLKGKLLQKVVIVLGFFD
jgi:hypothetical protein